MSERLIHNRYEDPREPLPEGSIPGPDGAGVTCRRMDGGHLTHGYARIGMGCVSPTTVIEDIAALRAMIEQQGRLGVQPFKSDMLDLVDKIATALHVSSP